MATKVNAEHGRELTLLARLRPESSSWVAARAHGSALLPYQVFFTKGIPPFAHTSPVYLEVPGRPARSPEDAAFFIAWCDRAAEWAKTHGRYEPAEKAEVLALFARARRALLER